MNRIYEYAIASALCALIVTPPISRGASRRDEFAGVWTTVHARPLFRQAETRSGARDAGLRARVISNFFWNDVYVCATGNGVNGERNVLQKIPVAGAVSDLAVGDFNGDGNDDFAIADFLESSIEVFVSISDGTYARVSKILARPRLKPTWRGLASEC